MLNPGDRFSTYPYTIKERLGYIRGDASRGGHERLEGARSEVYFACGDDRKGLVLKIAAATGKDASFRQDALKNEADILPKLKEIGPGVVAIQPIKGQAREAYSLKATDLPGQPRFCVLEYLPGGSLSQYLALYPKVDLGTALGIGAALARTLNLIHQKGYVHLDIKPGNVVFRRPLTHKTIKPVLIDFGIACRIGEPGLAAWSPGWVAPERYRAKARAGTLLPPAAESMDVYGLGLLLYHMITGELAFGGSSTLAQADDARPIPPSDYVKDLPPEVDALIAQVLHRQPGERPRMEDVVEELDALAAHHRPRPQPMPLRRLSCPLLVLPRLRRQVFMVLSIIILLVIALIMLWPIVARS